MAVSGTFYFCGSSEMCYKWIYSEAGEKSTLYINKWRVPNPPPKSINVTVKFKDEFEAEKIRSERDYAKKPELKNEPIIRYVHRVSCHSNTVKFYIEGYERPFDSIYIPCSFLNGNEDIKLVQIVINWN
ncbi:hypothetical protein RDV78_11170 [Bacillota bacterium LX-D]|nr:hypothetical protein [Bacillota bacterium LX-D]